MSIRPAIRNFAFALVALAILFCFAAPFLAQAAGASEVPTFKAPISSIKSSSGTGSVAGLFCTVAKWWLFFTLGLSIIMGMWAAWKYVLGQGEDKENTAARKMLQYSLIGVAVGFVALGIPMIAGDFLQISSTEAGQACSFGSANTSGTTPLTGQSTAN